MAEVLREVHMEVVVLLVDMEVHMEEEMDVMVQIHLLGLMYFMTEIGILEGGEFLLMMSERKYMEVVEDTVVMEDIHIDGVVDIVVVVEVVEDTVVMEEVEREMMVEVEEVTEETAEILLAEVAVMLVKADIYVVEVAVIIAMRIVALVGLVEIMAVEGLMAIAGHMEETMDLGAMVSV